MRRRLLITALVLAALGAGAGITAHADGDRQALYASRAAALRARWTADLAAGVPAASIAPLRAQLDDSGPAAPWWSPAWLQEDGAALLDRLDTATRSAWTAAMAGASAGAEDVIAQWAQFQAQQSSLLAPAAVTAAEAWPAQLVTAGSPGAITALTATWRTFLANQQGAVAATEQAQLATALHAAGGPGAVLATARRLVAAAASANLDPGAVPALATQLQQAIAAHDPAAAQVGGSLVEAIGALRSLLELNSQVGAQALQLRWTIDQAEAEGTPHAAALAGQRSAAAAQFTAARTTSALQAAQQALATVNAAVDAELAASQCGHPVGAGKVITISLSLQEMVFYDGGCVARATPVSTGRPQLRTPTGRFSIFYKKTPFTFISPWPKGSPFYYYPSPVSWVMEFASGGYFIHDAPWEAADEYGPGSEDNLSAASHGCVHTPTAVMQWAFAWTPLGTPVVISA